MVHLIEVGDSTSILETSSWPTRLALRNVGSLMRSRVNLTSSAVNGVPSCQTTSPRRLNVNVRAVWRNATVFHRRHFCGKHREIGSLVIHAD